MNMSMTADGKIATANRRISSFGSKRDHDHLLELRSMADGVMAGARTVDSNAVNLGPGPVKYRALRLRSGLAEYNLRIIISRRGTINPNAEIFKKRFSPIIIITTDLIPPQREREPVVFHQCARFRRHRQLCLVYRERRLATGHQSGSV